MNLRENIVNYKNRLVEEQKAAEKMLSFLDNCKEPFSRKTTEGITDGHFTASAFLLNTNKTKFLLMHHRKLGKWLQLGGHCDGNNNLLAVAIKEAKEESGILDIEPIFTEIYDIDIHWIPANVKEPGHYHYDVRFLLKTVYNDSFIKNHEAHELRWFAFNLRLASGKIILEDSVIRMVEKFKSGKY